MAFKFDDYDFSSDNDVEQDDPAYSLLKGSGLSSYSPEDIRSPEQGGVSAASKQIGKPVDDRGDFMRGLGNYVPQMRDMGRDIQTVAGVGLKKMGATDIGQSMIESGIAGSDAAEADIVGKDTDEFTTALDKGVMNVLTDWLPYQAGQTVGMAGEMALAVGAGALLGSAVGGPAGTAGGAATGLIGKAFIKKGLKEQASKIAEEYGEEAAQKFLKKQTGKAIGKDIAITGAAEFHGMGEVGGRMLDQLDKEGQSPDDLDFARFALASQGHAALERVSDMIAIKSLTRKLDKALEGNFFKAVAGRGMMTGAKEAPVEMGQTLLERYGAALPVDDQEAFHEYFNAAAAGFAMGGMMGGAGGGAQALSEKGQKDPTIKPGTEFTPEEQDTITALETILSDPNTPTEEKVKAADTLRATKANAEARAARTGPAQLGGTQDIDSLKAEFDATAAWGATTWKQNSPAPVEPESEINPPASFDEYVQEFEQEEAGQVAGQVEKDTGQVEKDTADTGKIETDQGIAEADQVADEEIVEEYEVEHYYDDDGNITDADGNVLNDEQIAQVEAEYLKNEQISQPDELETKGISSPTKSILYDENDKEHNVTYQVVEASDLEGSVNKDVNQFRDRDRKALRLAVEKIANNPLFDKVGVSSVMETGAPVVASDGKIVAGNGRFLGLSEAYGKGTSGAYTDGLMGVVEALGIDPASVQGMTNPVLIRRLDPDADTQNLAILSNEGGAAPMSALEQSTVDAGRIGELPADIETRKDGGLTEAARNGIAKRLIAGMPQNQANALVDENGMLSQEGEKRLDNAILNMAYGESSVLTRLTESREQNLQNLSQALLEAAPRIANMRNSIEGGVLFDADPVPYIVAAVEAMTAIRKTGQSVEEFVAQTDAFTEIAAETESVLKFFEQNVRNKTAMRDFMVNYTEQLASYGDPSQESMFERPEPTTKDVIENAKAETDTGTKEDTGDVKEGSRPDATDGSSGQEDGQREEGQADLLAEPEPTGETIAGYTLEEDPDYTGSHRGGWITRGDGKKIRAIFGTGDVQWGRDKSGAYVVDQLDRQKTGKKSHDEAKFDEHVLLMGFDTQAKAKTAYIESMPETDGKKWNGYTYITKFKRKSSYEDNDTATFVEDLDLTKPWREYTDIPTRTRQGEDATMEGIKAQKAKEKELDKSGGWDDIVDHWSSLLDMPKKVTRPEVTEEILPAEAKDIIDSWKEEAARQGKENKTNGNKIVLSLFDRSGVWAQPWADAGYDVRTIDLETDKVDVMDMDRDWFEDMGLENVHVVLAACPCTHFASTAARDWKEGAKSRVEGGKDNIGVTEEMIELTNQTMEIISYLQPSIYSIENPKGRIWKVTEVPGRPTMAFQPNNYGDPYTKETYLYGKFNPDLPTANVFPTDGSKMQSKLGSKDEKESGARSETPEGFAYSFFMANNDEANPGYLQLANEYVDAMPKKTSEKDRNRARSAYIVGVHQENITWHPEVDSVPKFVEDAYDQGRIDSDEEWRAEQVLTEEQLEDHIDTAVDRQDVTQDENDVKLLGKALSNWMKDDTYEEAVTAVAMPDSVDGIRSAYKAAFDRRLVTFTPEDKADFINGIRIGENPGVLYVSDKSSISLPHVFGHELYHDIAKESPTIHLWLKERLLETVNKKGLDVYSLESYQQALIRGHAEAGSMATIDLDHVIEELLADSLGDALNDPKFLQQLVDDNPGKFKKLLDFVTGWLTKVANKVVGHGSEEYFKDLQKFRSHLRHALNAHAQGKQIVTSVPAPKYSIGLKPAPVDFSVKSPLQVRVEASGGAKKDLTVKSKYEPKVKRKQIAADIKPHLADQHEARLNEIQAQHPRPLSGQAAWEKFMVEVYGTSDVPPAPFQALKYAKDPTVLAGEMGKINEKQKQMANEGLALTKKIRQLYDDGDADPAFTAKLFMWSYMSKSATAYHHEAGFLEMVMGGVDEHLEAAAEGNFDPAAYKAWANSLSLKDRSVAASVTSNVNDFGETFLQKLNVKNDEGVTGLKRLHDMISDRNITSKTIRREFFKLGEKLGIDNKVVSFTLLMSGREDVMVIDRIQARHLWDHPGFSFIKNLYEGDTKDNPEFIAWKKGGKKGKSPAKKVVINPGLAGVLNGYRGLALYEAIESELMNSIDKAYSLLGRKEAGTVGRWHWESWVLRSGQEVGHGTISGLVREYGGEGLDAYSEITSREGRYHQFAFGHEYSPANGGTRFVTDSAGKRFEFDLDSYNALMKEVKRQSKTKVSVTKAGFSVAAQKEKPWYNHPEVNRNYLDEIIGQHGKESREEATDKQGIQEAAPKRPAEATVQAADPSTVEQEYNSAKTSRNQVPALFTKLGKHLIETGGRNVDIGGGAWEKGTELLKTKYQMDSRVLDRFNRTEEHNQAVQDWIDNNPTDTATIANVLNVIKEPEIRQMVIQQGYDAVKTGGQVFISTYEGEKVPNPAYAAWEKSGKKGKAPAKQKIKGKGNVTKDGWQERRATASYIPEIEAVFGKGNVKRHGETIVATKTGSPKFSIKQPQFYSELSKQIANISQPSAPAAQWKGMIKKLTQKGVKPAEMEFVDIDGFLDSQTGKVQKADILRYLETNAVELYSVEKNQDTYDTKYSDYVTDGDYTNYQETLLQLPSKETYRVTAVIYSEDTDSNDEILTDLSGEGMEDLDYGRTDVPLYFVRRKASGTQSYPSLNRDVAERMLKDMEEMSPGAYEMFEKESEVVEINNFTSAQFRVVKRSVSYLTDSSFISTIETGIEAEEGSEYESAHWDEKNVAVHMRSTDRQFGGENLFVIEEIQSDWSQDGRKQGYKRPAPSFSDEEYIAQRVKAKEVIVANELFGFDNFTQASVGLTQEFQDSGVRDSWASIWDTSDITDKDQETVSRFIEMRSEKFDYEGNDNFRALPHTPFKKTDQWALLGFKKMLMKAVEQGSDRIAWIPGDLQADRYNLAETVDVITVDNRGGDSYDLVATKGDAVLLDEENITIARVESLIGKELATKVSEQKEFESIEYEGTDLKLGGEGMKGFYDKMLPSIVGKFVKKFGAKVEVTKLDLSEKKWGAGNLWNIRELEKDQDPADVGMEEITFEESVKMVEEGEQKMVARGNLGSVGGYNINGIQSDLTPVMYKRVFKPRYGDRYFRVLPEAIESGGVLVDVWSVKINDKMKEATNNGMPMFSIKPGQTLAEFQEEQESTEPFKEWSENAEVIEAEDVNDFKYVPGKPYVLKLNHGTTHEFWSFNSNIKGTKEGFFGAVNYFTSDEMDASVNYGSYESPDAMLRRDVLQDRIMGDLIDMPEEYGYSFEDIEAMEEQEISELARDMASDQIMGNTEQTMQLYVKTVNPFVIGGADSSWVSLFDHDAIIEEARETVADNNSVTVQEVIDNPEYEDELNEATYEAQDNQESPIIAAIETVAYRYNMDPSSLIAEVYELSGGDEMRAQDFESTLRDSSTLMYVEDPDTGDLVSSHVVAEIIQEMGYDSIIMKNADRRFMNMPMEMGTTHVHVFNENNTNIKSATENVGTFDPKNDDIRFNVKQTKTSEFRSWFGSSKVVDANGNPMIQYHGTVADFNEFTKGDIGYHVGTEKQANYRLKSLNIVRGGKPGQTEGGANIMPMYVRAENPLRMPDIGEWENPVAIYEEIPTMFDGMSVDAGYESGHLERKIDDAKEAIDDMLDEAKESELPEVQEAMAILVDTLKSNGYDSIVYENFGEIDYADDQYQDSYIVLDSNQLKSASGNTGEFSESGDIRFSLGSMFRPRPVQPQQIAEIRSGIRDRMDKFRFSVQDKLIDLKRKQSGLPAVPDYANPYQKAGIWEGKTAERMNDFDEASVQPLLEKMAEAKMDVADIGEWLVARHAREANLYLYGINPQIADFQRRSALSGMNNADADAILADPLNTSNAALQEVGLMIDKINSDRVDMLVDEGLMTSEMAAKWRGRYKHYVPLKREEAEGNDLMPSRGQGFSLKGKESKMRTGSAYWTPHMIVTNTLAQMESSMVRAGKNDVGKALLALVEQNPDDNFWGVAVDQKQKYVRNGKVVEGPKMWDSPNEVTVKRDGKDFVIVFNADNEKAMRLAAGMKNLNAPQLNGIVGAMGKISRFLSHINTSWNPEFVISNFFRDYQTAGYNLSNTELKNASKQVLMDVPKAMAGIRSALFGDGTHAWAQAWEDFRKHGGKTGWIDLHSSLEKRERDLGAMVDRVRDGKPSVGHIRNIFDKIDDLNAVVENGVRLAAYKNAIDGGLTPDAAAALAKDLTVNFNRKGNMGPMMNAMYMFYNASIQGSVRLLQTIMHSKRGRIMAGATIGFAIMLDMLNRSLADDDDDGENLYDALPNYVKAHNLIIMGQKEPIVKIPLPWGYNVLHTIGQSIGETINGQNVQPGELMTHVGMSMVDAFNPVGSGSPLQMIAPTVVDPFVQIAENKNFAGIPLKPEQMPFGAEKPLSQQYFSSAREMSKGAASMMNEITGGNEFRPGAVDVSPEWIDMIFDYFTGGAGRTALNSFDVAQRLVEGKPLETGKTPFVRKVTGYNQDHGIKSRYYEWSKSVAYSKKELKGLKGEEYAAAKQRPEARLVSKYTQTEKVLRKLRSTRRRLVKNNSSEKRIEAIDLKIRKRMASFNRAYATYVLNKGQ